jgi:putative flippase GtrA
MARYSAPLLIAATTYFMTLPAPARAHGQSSLAAGCANAYRFFCNQGWPFKDRAWLAAILTNLTAAGVAISLFLALQWLSSAAAMVPESGPVRRLLVAHALAMAGGSRHDCRHGCDEGGNS